VPIVPAPAVPAPDAVEPAGTIVTFDNIIPFPVPPGPTQPLNVIV